MRGLIIATALMTSIAGAALAQADAPSAAPNPSAMAPAAAEPIAPTPTNPLNSSSQTSVPTTNETTQPSMNGAANASGAAADTSARTGAGDQTSATGDVNSPSPNTMGEGAATTSDYPVCKTRSQDHCRVRSHR